MGDKKVFNAAAVKTTLTIDDISEQDVELFRRLIRSVIQSNNADDPLLYNKKDELNGKSISKFIHLALKKHVGEDFYLREVNQSEWEINTAYEAFKGAPDQNHE